VHLTNDVIHPIYVIRNDVINTDRTLSLSREEFHNTAEMPSSCDRKLKAKRHAAKVAAKRFRDQRKVRDAYNRTLLELLRKECPAAVHALQTADSQGSPEHVLGVVTSSTLPFLEKITALLRACPKDVRGHAAQHRDCDEANELNVKNASLDYSVTMAKATEQPPPPPVEVQAVPAACGGVCMDDDTSM
jgi:hypothetical protein